MSSTMRAVAWTPEKARVEIMKRYKNSAKDRTSQESIWKSSERSVFGTGSMRNSNFLGKSLDFALSEMLPGANESNADMATPYVLKNLRFVHAQMSANPPIVAMRPTTSDQDDHRKADAADRIVRWAMREFKLQEKQDQQNLQALMYGTGILKTLWDSTKGEILESDPETGEIKLEGDINISIPFIWNIFLDPDAKAADEVKWVIEKIYMDYDEACLRWPDKADVLKESIVEENTTQSEGYTTEFRDVHYNSVELLEYWETGLPSNGYLGRFCVTTVTGEVVEPPRPSPFRFKQAGGVSRIEQMDLPDEVKEARIARLPERAKLPYHILTDIDVPNTVWGKSSCEYSAILQENLNKLDTARLDNIQAASSVKMILPESTEVDDESLSNSPWDIVKITGNQPPFWMSAPQILPELSTERNNYIKGIDDTWGVNEAMFGQQSREQSGASMQYATNQGNMIRRRLFNKYVANIESMYNAILNLIRKHWTVERTINVLGKEKALEAIDIKGADIDGGFDVIGEYGTTLSLDPITRREEILSLQPLFEKAGVPTRTVMKMMKLNEVESLFDDIDLAENRQKEIFDLMISTGSYIAPKPYRDHENMIAWAMHYFMTQEFEALPDDIQGLCEEHIKARGQLAAQEKPAAGAPAAPPSGPVGPAGPVPPPSTGITPPSTGPAPGPQ